mgnify:CR=1 FL=1
MTPEHDKLLVQSFPLLYADRQASIRESCMGWGFECGDGWFKLIWDLSEKLEKIINNLPNYCTWCGDSEHQSICECGCKKYESSWIRAAQVKEKFGTLRFYMTSSIDEIDEHISVAEKLSSTTCENCGEAGIRRGSG